MRNSIDNNSRLSSSVKDASQQNITDTPLIQADVTQCRVCTFKGKSPEDLDRHVQNDHLDYVSLSPKMLQPKVMLKRLTRQQMSLRGLQPSVNLKRLTPRSIPLNTVESHENPRPSTSQQAMASDVTLSQKMLQPKVILKRLTRKMSPRRLQPSVNLKRITPRSIPLNTVESYENPRPGTSQQAMASNPIESPSRKNQKRPASTIDRVDKTPASRRRVDKTPDSRPRASRQKVPAPPSTTTAATTSPRQRTRDIQRATIEVKPSTDEQKKNAFDLAMRIKRRKTTHVQQSNTVDNTKKKKKKKKPKRRGGHRILDQYKHKNTRRLKKSHPAVQRNVAALGLSGYSRWHCIIVYLVNKIDLRICW